MREDGLALRLRALLQYGRFKVGVGPATLITFIGFLFGTLLPGAVGADAVRVAYFCSRVAERRMDAMTAILFDRVVGLYSLLLLGSLALAGVWLAGMWREGFGILLTAPVLLGLATVGGILFANMGSRAIPKALLARMPWRLKTFLVGTRALLRRLPLLATTVAISLVSHAFMVLSFVVVAIVIADPLPLFLHFAISPLAVTLNSVPVSPGGLGITEGAFAYLFNVAGSGNGALIGLLGRLLHYCVYAIGGSVSLLLLRWRGDPFASMAYDDSGLLADSANMKPTRIRGS